MQAIELPLRDIHLPEAIGWWPPAIGWWILAVLIPLGIYFIFKLYKRITRKTALKAAKKHFEALREDQQLTEEERLTTLSSLMRRTAISLYPRTEVANLTGNDWLEFLNKSLIIRSFKGNTGRLLTEEVYRKKEDSYYLAPLLNLCEDWLDNQKEPKT